MKTNDEMREYYRARYDAEVKAGGKIEINRSACYVVITMSDGTEWFYQDWQADDLLAAVPEWCDPAVYLLASAQDW